MSVISGSPRLAADANTGALLNGIPRMYIVIEESISDRVNKACGALVDRQDPGAAGGLHRSTATPDVQKVPRAVEQSVDGL